MRRLPTILAVSAGMTAFALTAALLFRPARTNATEQISLMQTLAEWKYPDSKWLGGASISDGGNPMLQSAKCRAILTTVDPIDKVIDFYTKKLVTPSDAVLPGTKADGLASDGKSVSIQDDSQGRPLTVRIIGLYDQRAPTEVC